MPRKPDISELEYSEVMSMTEPDNDRESPVLEIRVAESEVRDRSRFREKSRTATARRFYVVRHTTEEVVYVTVQSEPLIDGHRTSTSRELRGMAYAFAEGVREGDPNLER